MKIFKRISAALIAMLMLLSFAACNSTGDEETTTEPETTSYIREVKTKIAALNGPTGIGLAKLKADRDYAYEVEYYSDPQEIVPLLTNGEVDIAALPINLAANLYKKTDGGIQILAVNTLGVLHIIENGESIKDISDLKGKTIYATGQGSTPEYILNYILAQNGIDPEKDVTIEYKIAHNELATLAVEGSADICMLPEPFATTVLGKNENLRRALDLTDEWDKICDTQLAQGVIVARTEYIEQNPEYIEKFLSHNELSVNYLNENAEGGSIFLYENGYFDDVEVANYSVQNSNLVFVTGEEMKALTNGVFEVLYEASPSSIGGSIPDDGIYYGA